jgi:uncharacterized membrane protein YheB (UPF0754 family)
LIELPGSKELLRFVLPPIVGAFIGFFTNVLAIKMLFRPLREIRIANIRVPFTPGILPKQRKKLAQEIGKMVERELLTESVLRERLLNDEIKAMLQSKVAQLTNAILSRVNGEDEMFNKAYSFITTRLLTYLRKPEVHVILVMHGRRLFNTFQQKLTSLQRILLQAGQYDKVIEEKMGDIVSDIVDSVETALQSEENKNKIALALQNNIGDKSAIDAYITNMTIDFADRQIGAFLAALDVKRIVQERIDSLEMERVEQIILSVTANQFKWIDIFGALLGALIGIVQVLFAQFFS